MSVGPLAESLNSLVLRPNFNVPQESASAVAGTATPSRAARTTSALLDPATVAAQLAGRPTPSSINAKPTVGGITPLRDSGITKADSPLFTSASASTIYSTGFESSDGFTPGLLANQVGWSTFGGNTTQPVIASSYNLFGSQTLAIGYEPALGEGNLVGGFSPDLGSQPNGTYTVSVDLAVGWPTDPGKYMGGSDYYVAVLGDSQGSIVTDICFQNQGYIFVMTNVGSQVQWVYTGWQWGPGYPVHLDISIDATTNQINMYAGSWYGWYGMYDIFRGAVWSVPSVEQVVLYSDNLNQSDGVTCEYDNLTVTRSLLIPARAAAWWSDKIVVSDATGTNTDDVLYAGDNLSVDWAVQNVGDTASASSWTSMYVDGALRNTWLTPPIADAGGYFTITDYNLGSLSVGTHQITIVPDTTFYGSPLGSVLENEYAKTITIQPLGEIDGSLWYDTNGNGAWDSGEPALSGWTAWLDMNRNGQRDSGEPSTITDSNGNYTFTGLEGGSYVVAGAPPGGGAAVAASSDWAAGNSNVNITQSAPVTLGVGQVLSLPPLSARLVVQAKSQSQGQPFAALGIERPLASSTVALADDLPPSPSSFDLRTWNDVTPVKDQGALGGCWAFATYAAMESSILMAAGTTTSFSEDHLKDYHLFDYWPSDGGNLINISQAYLSRGSGPINASDSPYYDWDDVPAPGGTPSYYVRESPTFNTPEEIKYAVLHYGAVATEMCWDNRAFNSLDSTYYYSGTAPSNHAVTIVGWDDSKVTAAPTPGAWLIKNSWGTGFGDQGYFWISYADTVADRISVSYKDLVPASTYNRIYYHDTYGEVDDLNTDYAFNAFTPSVNQSLKAVQFFTNVDNASYEVGIYDSFSGGQLSGLVAGTSGTCEFSGYHTVDLPSSVSLTAGHSFYVYVHLINGGDYPMAASRKLDGYSSNATSSPGESYYYDGAEWVDLTTFDPTSNFCIKALAVDAPVPGTITASLSAGGRLTAQNLGVAPQPPTAVLSNSGPVDEGSTATVNFSNPTDLSPANIAAGFHYAFDFGNDGNFAVGDGTYDGSSTSSWATVPSSDLPDGPGSFVIRGRIIAQDGSFTDYTTTVTINNVAPSDLVLSLSSSALNDGDRTTLSGSFADPGTLDTHTVLVSWGDGTSDTLSLAANVTAIPPTQHIYAGDAQSQVTYALCVTVSDKDGAIVSAAASVTTPTPTVVALESDPSGGSAYLQPILFTASVGGMTGEQTPTGSVQFVVDGLEFGSPVALSEGTATITVSVLVPGIHNVGAIYTSDNAVAFRSSQTKQSIRAVVAPVRPIDITPPTTYTSLEGNATGSRVLATFTDANPGAAPTDFSGTIDWGDGTAAVSFTSGDVTLDAGTFSVQGSHVYAELGTCHVTVVINDSYGQTLTASNTTITVADAPLTDTTSAAIYNVTAGKSTGSFVLATFTDGNPLASAGDFTPVVTWGGAVIGTPSVFVQSASGSTWQVLGNPIYAAEGNHPIRVTVQDVGGSVVNSSGKIQFTASAALLSDATLARTYEAIEGNSTKLQVLATFIDANPKAQPGEFTPTVTWGGTLIGTPTVSVQYQMISRTMTMWKVVGSAVYAETGTHGVTVFVQDTAGNVVFNSGKTQFKVADAPLRDVTGAKTYTSREGSSTGSQVLATFTDANPYASLSDFTPTVAWGGTLTATSTPTVMLRFVSSTAKVSTWQVLGDATYAHAGKYTVAVSIQDVDGSSLVSKKVKFNVVNAPLTDVSVAMTYDATAGKSTGPYVLATFTDANPSAPASDFEPAVNWGGKLIGKPSVSVELVSRTDTISTWGLVGSVTYAQAGSYAVKIKVADAGGKSVSTSKTTFRVAATQSASRGAATAAVFSVAASPVRPSGPSAPAVNDAALAALLGEWTNSSRSSPAKDASTDTGKGLAKLLTLFP